jgi:hypothetical protein
MEQLIIEPAIFDTSLPEPLPVPFDVTLTPPALHTDDAPHQNCALEAALCAPSTSIDHDDKFSDMPVITKSLDYFKRLYETQNTTVAMELLQKRVQIDMQASQLITRSNDKDLSWNPDIHYIDLMICVPRGLGLAALLPNRRRMHTYEFTLNMETNYRTFSAKFAKLGFDPTGAMVWMGQSPSAEDVWLAWAPTDSLNIDCEDVPPGTCQGSTKLSTRHYRMSTMFMASMLESIGYRDLGVSNAYPDLDSDLAVHTATNFL